MMDRPRFSSVIARRISVLFRRSSERSRGTDSDATSLITRHSFAGRLPCACKYSRTAACQVLEKAWSSQVGRCGHRLTGLESSFRAGGPNCAKSFVTRKVGERAAEAYVAPEVGLPWQNG